MAAAQFRKCYNIIWKPYWSNIKTAYLKYQKPWGLASFFRRKEVVHDTPCTPRRILNLTKQTPGTKVVPSGSGLSPLLRVANLLKQGCFMLKYVTAYLYDRRWLSGNLEIEKRLGPSRVCRPWHTPPPLQRSQSGGITEQRRRSV